MRFQKNVSSVVDGCKYHYYVPQASDGRRVLEAPFIHEEPNGSGGLLYVIGAGSDRLPTLEEAKAFIRMTFPGY